MKNIFICGDHHFHHANIMKYDKRPFSSVEEMNEVMIERHNKLVNKGDDVYTVGDFCFGGITEWKNIKDRLNGQWHLIKGNHDRQNFAFLRSLFVTVSEIKNLRVEGQTIVLCHNPMYTWAKSHYGSYHCHGHEHGELRDTYDQTGKILDVGVNTNDYYPYHVGKVLGIMKGKPDNWNQLEGKRVR